MITLIIAIVIALILFSALKGLNNSTKGIPGYISLPIGFILAVVAAGYFGG